MMPPNPCVDSLLGAATRVINLARRGAAPPLGVVTNFGLTLVTVHPKVANVENTPWVLAAGWKAHRTEHP